MNENLRVLNFCTIFANSFKCKQTIVTDNRLSSVAIMNTPSPERR